MNTLFTEPKSGKVSFAYRMLWVLLFPVAFIVTLRSAIRRQGGWRFISERFGFFRAAPLQTRPLWLHAASVGEVNAVLPLIRLLYQHYPDIPLLVTTATPTGARIVQKQIPELVHAYLPLDYGYAVNRFLHTFQPFACLMMETELWPRIYSAVACADIPLVIINGRLSAKTLERGAWLHSVYRGCLQNTDKIFARSDNDRAAFIRLGAEEKKVEVMGNIKFSAAAEIQIPDHKNPVGRLYVLAASTHADEEYQLARLWQTLNFHHCLLVIAPRHPERRQSILRQLQPLGLEIAVRSRGEVPDANTRLYLADTLGELVLLMRHAEWVFMGGSLIRHGGQNLLEPAALGKAIVTGPYMYNFQQEFETLKTAGAVQQAADIQELQQIFIKLIQNPDYCAQLGNAAFETLHAHGDIAMRYQHALRPFIDSRRR